MPIVVPKPKTLDKFWVKLPIYLFLMGMKFLTMGKPPRANPTAQGKVLKPQSILFSLVCMLPEKAQAILSWHLLSLFGRFPLFSRVPPQKCQPPPLYPLISIYKLPLVGLSWWEDGFPCWWVPLRYILGQMGPTIHDWRDSLETCTWRWMVLRKWFPSRPNRSYLFGPDLFSGTSRVDGLLPTLY